MGGELQECGCVDGPWSEEDPTWVSVRCYTHIDQPGEGVQLVRRADGSATPRNALPSSSRAAPKMAIPQGRQRRHR